MRDNKLTGNLGEEFATALLYAEGYEILEQNFRCKLGEIDIICCKEEEICFVEVKTRTSLEMGLPSSSVGKDKQRRIRRVAEYYLMTHDKKDFGVKFQVFELLINQIDNAF